MKNHHDSAIQILTQWFLVAEQVFASKVVAVLEVFSENGIQQNFFSACPPPTFAVPINTSKMTKRNWLRESLGLSNICNCIQHEKKKRIHDHYL